MFYYNLLLLLPSILGSCPDNTCRSSTCCAETDCVNNQPDPDLVEAQACPCMISQTATCVSPGTTLTLECDPGGVCQHHCSWSTPVGSCTWNNSQNTCEDSSIRFLNKAGTCNIQVVGMQARHAGVWRCKSIPYTSTFSDSINITISTDCSSGTSGAEWWRSGWTAPVFWLSMVVIIVIIVIIIFLCFLFCCPWFCLCLPCCARRNAKLEDRSGRKGRQERKTRRQSDERRSTHSPVIVDDNTQVYEQMSGYSSEDGNTSGRSNQYHNRHNQDYESVGHEVGDGLHYDVPRHYMQQGEDMRTAKKKSNLVTKELEDRIRKASGVAKQNYI